MHEAKRRAHVEKQVHIGVRAVRAVRRGSEDAHPGSAGALDCLTNAPGVVPECSSPQTGTVEAKQPVHLGLAASDLGGNLGLGHALRGGAAHGAHEFGAGGLDRGVAPFGD